MNTCQRIDSLVSAFLEHEASPAEIRFVESHLPTCSRCRAQLHDVSLAMEAVAHLPRIEARAEFTDEVLARTRGLKPATWDIREPWILTAPRMFTARRVLSWGVPLAAAAALVMALVTLQVTHRSSAPQTASQITPTQTQPLPKVNTALPGSSATQNSANATPPEVMHLGKGEGQSLGMARDSYAVGTQLELRTPREGGTPILTPVASRPDAPVVVTF